MVAGKQSTRCSENCTFQNGKLGQIETQRALPRIKRNFISAKINLKFLASEAVGASMKMMMKKEVKSSSFDNCRFTTLPMLSDNIIHQVSHKN